MKVPLADLVAALEDDQEDEDDAMDKDDEDEVLEDLPLMLRGQ